MGKYFVTKYTEFTEANPDKGTETLKQKYDFLHKLKFTEANPDKGTETLIISNIKISFSCLQKLTPIRGRKQYIMTVQKLL